MKRLKVRALGTPGQLLIAERSLLEVITAWEPIVGVDDYELELFRAPPDLLGHVLVLTETVEPQGHEPLGAAGCALSCEAAVLACVGELVERWCARRWEPPENRFASAADLLASGEDVFPVDDYLGRPLDAARWPFRPYDPRSPLLWVPAEDLFDGSPVWVPHSLVVLAPTGGPDSLAEVTTVGMAAGQELDRATEHALLELVERDTLMRRWIRHEPLETLPPPASAPHVAAALEQDASLGWETVLLGARSELGPEVAVVLTSSDSREVYAIGASAHADPAARASHALAEALQLRLKSSFETSVSGVPPLTFDDRLHLYADSGGLALLYTRLVGAGSGVGVGAERVELVEILRRLHARGGRAVRVILAAAAGVVVRVLATRLQAMDANEACARITAPELVVAGAAADYLPHPFA